jgi:PilZ domain
MRLAEPREPGSKGLGARKLLALELPHLPVVPSDITLLVADATRMAAITSRLRVTGRVIQFTANHLVSALEAIQFHHPKLIAVEALFARTPQGRTFIERIERLAIRGLAIQLIVQRDGAWTTTPYCEQPAAAVPEGVNTRRAHRFKVLKSLHAVVENGEANLVNISILGAQVVSQPPLRPNEKVKIVLPNADEMVRVTAHVAWSTFEHLQQGTEAYYRAGMEFTDAAKEILEDYCRRHCSEDPLPSY